MADWRREACRHSAGTSLSPIRWAVVVDQGVITSRQLSNLDAFSAKIIEEIAEGRHTQRSAAA